MEAFGYAVHLFNLSNALHTAKHNRSVDMAVPYYWDTVENASIREEYISSEVIYGAGNIISNVLDYRLWLCTMIDEMGPISKAQHTELRKPRSFAQLDDCPDTSPQLYALGWFVSQYRGKTIVYHGGSLPGFAAQAL